LGRIVQEESSNLEKIQMNIAHLPDGVYYLNITRGSMNATKKLIIK
ncbi:MAG: T9SS type A sorting domain-containing protein, partial [Flavobacteriaceae bacterium]|nr:T9SS type A sorting domain-containing protein [Flavobacteriaceae bacterium]